MKEIMERVELESALAQAVPNLRMYELKLVLLMASRLLRGQIAFGPFENNPRNMRMEAAEEGADGALYTGRDIDFRALDLYLAAAIESMKKVG